MDGSAVQLNNLPAQSLNSHPPESLAARSIEQLYSRAAQSPGLSFWPKRCFDLALASLLLVGLTPFLLLVALVLWLQPGHRVIFRQTRIGLNGRTFVMYKFCTMVPNGGNRALSYIGPERRKRHKTRRDPRVTRLGRLLRQTSIDELPQLFNVLRGDMSVVGPRPELPEIVARYQPWQHQRHRVPPGLTGWWQIQGRSELPMHEYTELDLHYVQHQSLALDLEILVRTLPVLLLRAELLRPGILACAEKQWSG